MRIKIDEKNHDGAQVKLRETNCDSDYSSEIEVNDLY